jgi:methionyl-tRNA formyltransferase
MRVIFMGTPDFAVAVLDALVEAGHEVICVVAQPDRPKGRGHKMVSPPTIQRARELGLETRQPKAVRRGPFVEWMTTAGADVAVVVAYGRILIPALLKAPKYGCINVHASVLPKYRGAAPINWAVVRGEAQTGVSTMQMDAGLDTGDVLEEMRTPIGADETAGELYQRLSVMGATLAVQTLANLATLKPKPQNHDEHSLAPLIDRSDAEIDWTQSAKDIHNLIRGFSPWPTAWTTLKGARLKVHRSQIVEATGTPGTIVVVGKTVVVATGSGGIALTQVQLAGKRAQAAQDLVNSGRFVLGMTLTKEA